MIFKFACGLGTLEVCGATWLNLKETTWLNLKEEWFESGVANKPNLKEEV